uniref:Odorant-binding protein 32 n=1 Tax=Encarsia formosa TaxID=32400 RepID=A0A514TU05_ENCFO|nr:odorant-binding protein 32 [Encarsia formosa]
MKALFVIFSALLILVHGKALSPDLENSTPKVKLTMKQCLKEYNVNPAILEPDIKKSDDLLHSLTEEKKGCITACMYRSFNWLRPDGSLDIDSFTESDTPEESKAEKEKYLKLIAECKAEVGKNDCKFFSCLARKDQ